MISHIRNKYLRRSVLILSSPFFILAIAACNICLGILATYEEYTDAFKGAWRGRQP